jgi:hypothetical protein
LPLKRSNETVVQKVGGKKSRNEDDHDGDDEEIGDGDEEVDDGDDEDSWRDKESRRKLKYTIYAYIFC